MLAKLKLFPSVKARTAYWEAVERYGGHRTNYY